MHEWMVVIRAYGTILYQTRKWGAREGEETIPLTPAHIDSWMADCASCGITTVLWRANCAGTLTYPSRHTGLAGEVPLPGEFAIGDCIKKQLFLSEDYRFLGEQCKRFNNLEAAVTSAHRHGLKIYLDFFTFDLVGAWCTPQQWPEGGNRTFDPDLWLWSKDQKKRFAGIPCYAEPRVRELRIREISEGLDFGIDGVVLGFFSHNDGWSEGRPNTYGYNPVITREFENRYKTDLFKSDLDTSAIHRLYRLHGELFTQFVREAGSIVRARGKKFLSMARMDGVHGWGGEKIGQAQLGLMGDRDLRDGTSELPFTAGMYLDWERWGREDLLDGLIVWAPFPVDARLLERMSEKAGKPVYLWRKYSCSKGNFNPPQSLEGYHRELRAVSRSTLDGYVLHLTVFLEHELFRPDWRNWYPAIIAK